MPLPSKVNLTVGAFYLAERLRVEASFRLAAGVDARIRELEPATPSLLNSSQIDGLNSRILGELRRWTLEHHAASLEDIGVAGDAEGDARVLLHE